MGAKKIAKPKEEIDDNSPRPRLHKLIIKNFRAIGETPVEIELDQIVVLVGSNNVGKSSILRAYELIMLGDSKEARLTLEDFPNCEIKENALPEIILESIVFDEPGEEWIWEQTNGEKLVKEKWTWNTINTAPKKVGYSNKLIDWHPTSGPWGAANVAMSKRPQPHRVNAFDSPEAQAKEIIELLETIIKERIESFKSNSNEEDSEYIKMLQGIIDIQKRLYNESKEQISKIEDELSSLISSIFPNYKVEFDAEPEKPADIKLFGGNSKLKMGPADAFKSNIERQGSGARRTLLWTALRILSESKGNPNRPHILLLDEPEICLHPSAIRQCRDVLYNLPKSGNWQVVVTTHSPAFIDISKDNTTIVRVERNSKGSIVGTTVFRPAKVQLTEDDKEHLKLMNIFDPYVAEFFFGGHTIIVEGDTEYSAFKYVISQKPEIYKDIHIIRARGKATIVSLIKILNQFGTSYSVLHDSDTPKTLREGKEIINGAWTKNKDIKEESRNCTENAKVRVLASISNFEKAFFGKEVNNEKPYNALMTTMKDATAFEKVELCLKALIDHTEGLPEFCIEWDTLEELELAIK